LGHIYIERSRTTEVRDTKPEDKAIYIKVPPAMAVLVLILSTAAPFLASQWVENSMRTHYEKQLEDYRQQIETRNRAALIAEYVSMWYVSGQINDVNSMEKIEFYQRINKISFELALFLPAEIYRELGPALVKQPDAKTAGDILIDVRRHLLVPGDLTADNIIYHWPKLKQLVEKAQSEKEKDGSK
jgi:hypothetical protein